MPSIATEAAVKRHDPPPDFVGWGPAVYPRAKMPARLLVLWDLTGVLLPVPEADMDALWSAAAHATGVPIRRPPARDGRPDPLVVRETLEHSGVPAAWSALSRVLVLLPAALRNRLSPGEAHDRAAAARRALRAVARVPGVVQAAVSADVRANARLKARLAGLDAYLVPRVGAYGSDDCRWTRLLLIAERCGSDRYDFGVGAPRPVLVTGTPKVVRAGLARGLRTIGVTAGSADERALAAAGAPVVVPDAVSAAEVICDGGTGDLPVRRPQRRAPNALTNGSFSPSAPLEGS